MLPSLREISFWYYEAVNKVSITQHIRISTGLVTCSVGGAVASWLVHSTLEWAVRVRALAGDIVLSSQGRHLILTVPLSTQVYKWAQANFMLGITLWWTSIPSRGSRNTLRAKETGISSGLMSHLARTVCRLYLPTYLPTYLYHVEYSPSTHKLLRLSSQDFTTLSNLKSPLYLLNWWFVHWL